MVRTLVQLSDSHVVAAGAKLNGRIDTAAFLSRAVDSVRRLAQPPEAVVVTGDLTDGGRPEEYAHLRRLLAPLDVPVHLLPGNHDDRNALRAAFPDSPGLQRGGAAFVQYAVDLQGMRLVAIDTVVPLASHGALDAARLADLERMLDVANGRPCIVAMHHPPFRTLIGPMDEIGLVDGATQFAELIALHPRVERVICGHLHRSIQARFAGTIAMCAPSTAHQLSLDFSPAGPAALSMEPPGFLVHAWDDASGSVATHLVATGDFGGPVPFDSPGATTDG